MPKDYILAIDQGTTGSTALVFDRNGTVRGKANLEFTQHYPQPGWVEHDAEEMWTTTLRAVEAALQDAFDIWALDANLPLTFDLVWDDCDKAGNDGNNCIFACADQFVWPRHRSHPANYKAW